MLAGTVIGVAVAVLAYELTTTARKAGVQPASQSMPTNDVGLLPPESGGADSAIRDVGSVDSMHLTRAASEESLDDGSEIPIDEVPSDGAFSSQITAYAETFLTNEPDILGWNALLGELSTIAELDQASIRSGVDGKTEGEFSIPGSNMRVSFEISPEKYKVILQGKISTKEVVGAELDIRAQIGGTCESGGISQSHGSVQFLPVDLSAQNALDNRIVGYVYECRDDKTTFRPMEARMHEGLYQLRITPEEANKTLDYGDLKPAYDWYTRIRDVGNR